ncbi:hypothetical protein ACQ4PT_026251 [Festuca glaucescens]
MSRRFVNLLVSNLGRKGRRPDFYLHRIDPASLFHPTGSTKPSAASATTAMDALTPARLPRAAVSLDWPCPPNQNGWMEFMAFGDDVVAIDHDGRTLLYVAASGAVRTMSQAKSPRPNAISVTVGDGLYVLATNPGPPPRHTYCFQALVHDRLSHVFFSKDWHWRSFRSPPFDSDFVTEVKDPTVFNYEPGPAENADPHAIDAYTVVGGSEIWLSTAGRGTYSFDTASREWRQVGHWALPFRGRVEYIPEHGLWFGFTDGDERLCAADLAIEPPEQRIFPLRHVWENDPPTPEGWTTTATRLMPLGSGKLCVARCFRRTKGEELRPPSDYRHEKAESLAVLAGVEIV